MKLTALVIGDTILYDAWTCLQDIYNDEHQVVSIQTKEVPLVENPFKDVPLAPPLEPDPPYDTPEEQITQADIDFIEWECLP